MTQCLDLRCCIIQIWIGLLIIFRLPNTNCFEVSLVSVRHLSFGKKCNITRSIVISFCIHALLFIRMNFLRIFRLKIVENLRMSQECSEAQIQINIEIFLWTYMKYGSVCCLRYTSRQNNSEHCSVYLSLSLL